MRVVGNVTAYYSKNDYPSHHYRCKFSVKGVDFTSVEQFMMYCKAMVFLDIEVAEQILATDNPQTQKILGRKVKGYVDQVWVERREAIVFIGNREKYRQNPVLLALLLTTGNTRLVEASPRDTLWGVGLDERDDRIADPDQWLGENLHGKIQERVRAYFQTL